MGAVKTGGQGSVYKGRRMGELLTAIKILPTPIHLEDESDRNFKDFQNEVEKLKKVNELPNPNVVKILSSGVTESGSFPFIEMEFIEGPGLEDMLQPPHLTVFPLAEVLKVAEQLASALAHCHKVNVKHGDIKSNNVKFKESAGNYVLLDFGMAIMSDEQRRTSMRYAGAVEFMAPEQNEGLMFFQTDLYSYGIVLYELIAGEVPFILKDKSGTSRNKVMLSHIESPVPNMLPLRQHNLPASWNESRKEMEMQVPAWLKELVNKCLEKNPFDRFKDGSELYEHIMHKRVEAVEINAKALAMLTIIKNENERLKSLVLEYQDKARQSDMHYRELASNVKIVDPPIVVVEDESIYFPARKRSFLKKASIPLVCCSIIFVAVLLFFNNPFVKSQANKLKSKQVRALEIDSTTALKQFKLKSGKAYFHNNADPKTRRNAYLLAPSQTLTALKDSNNFIYIEFVNSGNKRSKGWLKKQDLRIFEPGESKNELPLTDAKHLVAN